MSYLNSLLGMGSYSLSALLRWDNGIAAIREGLLTAQQAIAMRPDSLDTLLRWDNGIAALRKLSSSKGQEQFNNITGQELSNRVSEIIESNRSNKPHI